MRLHSSTLLSLFSCIIKTGMQVGELTLKYPLKFLILAISLQELSELN